MFDKLRAWDGSTKNLELVLQAVSDTAIGIWK